jgi:hypothetical protein
MAKSKPAIKTVDAKIDTPAQAVIATPASVRVVTVDPVREYVKAIRKQRVMNVSRASGTEYIVDAIDGITSVATAIRKGAEDAHTEGRAEAAANMRAACDMASKAGASPAKVCALKWANLARLASAKRK